LSVPPEKDALRRWAKRAEEALRDKGIEFVASSDLARAKQSAAALAEALGVDHAIVTPDLRTWNTGDLEGERYNDVEAELRRYVRHSVERVPGGEPFAEFVDRWKRGFRKLADHVERTEKNGVAVVHGNEFMALAAALGTGPVRYIRHDELPQTGSIFEVRTSLRS
jgi:broad specificity phosphatase PhoE